MSLDADAHVMTRLVSRLTLTHMSYSTVVTGPVRKAPHAHAHRPPARFQHRITSSDEGGWREPRVGGGRRGRGPGGRLSAAWRGLPPVRAGRCPGPAQVSRL